MMREACILEALCHAGVPRVFECGTLDRRPWIATDVIDGVSIEHATSERPLATGEALAIVRDAAAVLAHAHDRGVVHRKITPTVIIRTPERSSPICITDWGDASINDSEIPHVVDPEAQFYRAPELVAGHGDGRADVFALGAVMFEAVTLVLPEPFRRFPGIPAGFHRLLESMLRRDPRDRPVAAWVHAEAARLAEVFSDAEGPVEEVEVELIDISHNPPPMPSLGWMPPHAVASPERQALGTGPHRKPARGIGSPRTRTDR